MIERGQTIVYKVSEDHLMFYWLCDIKETEYIFFNWYGNPEKEMPTDFWRMSKKWFNDKINDGKIEIYDSLPLEQYGDIFTKQANERNI